LSEKDFIFSKSKDLLLSGLNNFPSDFLTKKNFNSLEIPEKNLILGKEFFGSYEVTTPAGDFVMTFNNVYEAKYIVYASKNRKREVKIPVESGSIKSAVESYEKYLDQLLLDIKKDYSAKFRNGKNITSVSNEIFRKLNLTRL
jgi:hypothetical protein